MSLDTFREWALALPGSAEQDHFGSPSFRVRGRIFAQMSARHPAESRLAVLKLSLADRSAITMAEPETFAAVPAWGRHGWTHVKLVQVDAGLFHGLLKAAWRQVAPKKLVAQHPSS